MPFAVGFDQAYLMNLCRHATTRSSPPVSFFCPVSPHSRPVRDERLDVCGPQLLVSPNFVREKSLELGEREMPRLVGIGQTP